MRSWRAATTVTRPSQRCSSTATSGSARCSTWAASWSSSTASRGSRTRTAASRRWARRRRRRSPWSVGSRPQVVEDLAGPLGLDQLRSRIDELADAGTAGGASVLALRLDGRFASVRLRSVAAQTPPYPPLVEVTEHQQEWTVRDLDATVVGFRFPDASAGVEVPGYHLHLLSSDRRHGGHVLDLELDAGVVALDGGDELHVAVPEGTALGASGGVGSRRHPPRRGRLRVAARAPPGRQAVGPRSCGLRRGGPYTPARCLRSPTNEAAGRCPTPSPPSTSAPTRST